MFQEFNWEQELYLLAEDKGEVSQVVIEKFAKSKLKNEFFVQQFETIVKEPFSEKKYWKSFARILIKRGINEIYSVQKQILIWLQDINWPGSDIIFDFIVNNITMFKESIKECLVETLKNDDEAWLNALLTVAYKSKGMSNKEIHFNLVNNQKVFANGVTEDNLTQLFDKIIESTY